MDANLIKVEEDDGGRSPANSAFNGKIILTSVVILLVAFVIVVFFHIYAGLFLPRRNRHHHPRNLSPRGANYFASSDAISQGLDPSILKTLSTFRFSCKSKTNYDPPLECAVCLSEFEDDEIGRVLPNCNHCFHVQCVDIWFQFHSNCPLCRAPVQPIQNLDDIAGLESGLSSVLNPMSQRVEDQMVCSTSVCDDKKLPELTSITWETPVISHS